MNEVEATTCVDPVQWHGYNIIRFDDRYYVIPHALGPVDLVKRDVAPMIAEGAVFEAATQREVELMVLGTQTLVSVERAPTFDANE